jgi:hypothetical protein
MFRHTVAQQKDMTHVPLPTNFRHILGPVLEDSRYAVPVPAVAVPTYFLNYGTEYLVREMNLPFLYDFGFWRVFSESGPFCKPAGEGGV